MRVPEWVPLAHPALEIDTPVLTVDLHPTILELAGLSPQESGVDGRSLLSWLEAGVGTERVICGEYGRDNGTAFATDGTHKYIYYAHGGIEHLFDVVNDPDNLHNLSHSPGHEGHLERLKAALIDYLQRFDRPLVQDGELVQVDVDLDEYALRGRNPCAWRGPMRYGQGYGGGW
jgi:arylsulfatase A-like enzyme